LHLAASGHGVAALLGERVIGGSLDVDARFAERLVRHHQLNCQRVVQLHHEAAGIVSTFHAAGITPVALKGAAMLLESPDPSSLAWRPFSDIDLLVAGVPERRIDMALASIGYCLRNVSWKHRTYTPCAPGPPLQFEYADHIDNPRDIEVHMRVAEAFRGMRWDITPILRDHRRQLKDGGGSAIVPTDNAMALHLVVHASIAVMEGLLRAIQLVDVARAVARADVDWLVDQIERAGAGYHARFVYPAAALAARETGNADCARLAAALIQHVPSTQPAWLQQVDLYDLSWTARMESPLLDRHQLWSRSRADRLRMTAHKLFPAPDELSNEPHIRGHAPISWYPRHYLHLARRAAQLPRRGGNRNS
jgi:hypothetical protein